MYSELDSYISMNQATLHNIFGYPFAMMVLHFFYCFLMKQKTILVHEWGRNNQMGEKQPDGEEQPDGRESARWGRNSQIGGETARFSLTHIYLTHFSSRFGSGNHACTCMVTDLLQSEIV